MILICILRRCSSAFLLRYLHFQDALWEGLVFNRYNFVVFHVAVKKGRKHSVSTSARTLYPILLGTLGFSLSLSLSLSLFLFLSIHPSVRIYPFICLSALSYSVIILSLLLGASLTCITRGLTVRLMYPEERMFHGGHM